MAFKLDNDLLEELGLAALTADEKQAMLRQILETLEMRVGTTLASKMTDAQLDEFEQLMPTETDTPDAVGQKEQQALQWLESNFPNYKQVVNDELEKLKSEIKQSAPHIVVAAQQAAVAASAAPQPSANPSAFDPAPAPSPYPPQPGAGSSLDPLGQPPAMPQQQPAQSYSPPSQPQPGFAPPAAPSQPSPFQPMPPPSDDQGNNGSYPQQAA